MLDRHLHSAHQQYCCAIYAVDTGYSFFVSLVVVDLLSKNVENNENEERKALSVNSLVVHR